jgi:hypothetical protein
MEDVDIFKGFGVRVMLPPNVSLPIPIADDKPLSPEQQKEMNKDAFLKIRETLTRMGVASRKEKNLYQSAHILHKRGQYAIVHFKELFALDGKPTNIDEEDIARRNRIVALLHEWGLLTPLVPLGPLASINHIKIVKHSEKNDWNLVVKYSVGNKKKT